MELVKISLNPCWLFLDGSNASSSVAIQSKGCPSQIGLGFQVSRALCCSYFGFLTLTWHLAGQADCFCKHWQAVPKNSGHCQVGLLKVKVENDKCKKALKWHWNLLVWYYLSSPQPQVTVNSGLETKYSLKLRTVPARVCLFVMQKRACLRLHHMDLRFQFCQWLMITSCQKQTGSKGKQNRPKTKENNSFVKSIFRSADMRTEIP